MFQFFHRLDVKRIMDGSPWSFDNYLLVMRQSQIGDLPQRVPLN